MGDCSGLQAYLLGRENPGYLGRELVLEKVLKGRVAIRKHEHQWRLLVGSFRPDVQPAPKLRGRGPGPYGGSVGVPFHADARAHVMARAACWCGEGGGGTELPVGGLCVCLLWDTGGRWGIQNRSTYVYPGRGRVTAQSLFQAMQCAGNKAEAVGKARSDHPETDARLLSTGGGV